MAMMFDYIWLTAPNKTDQAILHIPPMCDLQISDKVYGAISFSTTISEKKKENTLHHKTMYFS